MSILTYVGAGQMASALTYPVIENGHEVRLVGTPLTEKSLTSSADQTSISI